MKFSKKYKKPISKSCFAEFAEVNKSSITRGIQSGLIVQNADGLIDVYDRKNLEYLRSLLDRRICNMPYASPERKNFIKDYEFVGFLLSTKLNARE